MEKTDQLEAKDCINSTNRTLSPSKHLENLSTFLSIFVSESYPDKVMLLWTEQDQTGQSPDLVVTRIILFLTKYAVLCVPGNISDNSWVSFSFHLCHIPCNEKEIQF